MADYGLVSRQIPELKTLGVRWVMLTGGNVLLFPHLPETLELCDSIGLSTSVSLSGIWIERRLCEWGDRILALPTLLMFSVDGDRPRIDADRGSGNYQALRVGLGAARKCRKRGTTQLVYTLMPGEGGNISKAHMLAVLRLADEFDCEIVFNLVYGTDSTKTKVERLHTWAGVTEKEVCDILWFIEQPRINKHSLWKLAFLFDGGNDIGNRTCRATEAVITIAGDRVVSPCLYNWYESIPIVNSIESVIWSAMWQNACDLAGTHDCCKNCTASCYIGPSQLLPICDNEPVWREALTGI